MPTIKYCLLCLGFLVTTSESILGDDPPAELRRWLGPQEWQRDVASPVLSLGAKGEFDETHIFAPTVTRENGEYKMWYCGSSGFAHDLAPSRSRDQYCDLEANRMMPTGMCAESPNDDYFIQDVYH